MPRICYLPDDTIVDVEEGDLILDTSLQAGIPHLHVCGGAARCSTCRVLVLEGVENCGDRNAAEQAIAKRLRLDPSVRLACQTQILGDITVRRLALDAEDVESIRAQVQGKADPEFIGQEKLVAILFADLRRFTSLSETLLPYDVIDLLNRYFRRMGTAIENNGGTINNYMGDGLMALFGMNDSRWAAERAVRAGLDMIEALETLNPYVEALYHRKLEIGIGIHYGGVVIGEVGAMDNRRQTAIGDAVNFASRIESANKEVGSNLLVSEEVYNCVRDQVKVKQCVHVQLKGKSGDYPLYEIVAIDPADAAVVAASRNYSQSDPRRLWTRVWAFLKQCWRKIWQWLTL
jgi:adenylate cyclase